KVNQSRLIYGIPSTEAAFVRARFSQTKLVHSVVPFMEALLLLNKNSDGKKMYIHAGKHQMELVVIQDGSLQLYNQFEYRSPEDFVYFPLFVSEQLQLNPEQIEVYLMGAIT